MAAYTICITVIATTMVCRKSSKPQPEESSPVTNVSGNRLVSATPSGMICTGMAFEPLLVLLSVQIVQERSEAITRNDKLMSSRAAAPLNILLLQFDVLRSIRFT